MCRTAAIVPGSAQNPHGVRTASRRLDFRPQITYHSAFAPPVEKEVAMLRLLLAIVLAAGAAGSNADALDDILARDQAAVTRYTTPPEAERAARDGKARVYLASAPEATFLRA